MVRPATDYRRITEGPPSVDADQAREIARRVHGIEAVTLSRLPGETDANYRISGPDGAQYVLKVASAAERGRIEVQDEVLRHVERTDPELPVPRVVGTADWDLGGEPVVVRLLTWVPGEPLISVSERSDELYTDIGAVAGRLAAAMATAPSVGVPESHYWDLRRTDAALEQCEPFVTDPELIGRARELLAAHPVRWEALPEALVHHDVNTLNVVVGERGRPRRTTGILDFGDMLHTARVADLAILLAALTRTTDRPLRVAALLTAAYHGSVGLTEDEVDALYPLLVGRVAVVAATTARLAQEGSHGDPRHRTPDTTRQLARLLDLPAELATATLREACGFEPYPPGDRVLSWLDANRAAIQPVIRADLALIQLDAASEVYDEADPRDEAELLAAVRTAVEARRPDVAVARYAEPRFLGPARRSTGADEAASVSLGVTLFAAPGTAVCAPLDGVVEPSGGDGRVVLAHETADGTRFWTSLRGVAATVPPDSRVAAGQQVGHVVGRELVAQLAAVSPTAIPTHARRSEFDVWSRLVPDSSVLLGADSGITAWTPVLPTALAGRHQHLPRTHPTYFSTPINMVRARDCLFFDEDGRGYLDALNNVTLLGHGHPRLVEAAARQLRRLNTNSRFVYDVLTDYAERLTATLPDGLDVVYFLNSGSEANDLALRMSRYVTGRHDIAVIEHAYHGYTSLVSDVSPARYKRYGKPDWVHPTAVPDRYRGEFGYRDPDSGSKYAARAAEVFSELDTAGRPAAAFIYESLLAGGGQVVLPPGYLRGVHRAARERGILTIADEVQVGFGRLGEAFWGFQTQGEDIRPDFVTMGKAMGNGFPVSAMVTTREISERFDATGRFFSTYGGNPAACAVGLELLKVLEEEGLQENALTVGQYLRDRLGELAERHQLIGDVRGQGFYSGVEFVKDRETKEPASAETLLVCERLKDEGVLVYPTGPDWNILKLKPPLTFTETHADTFVETLDRVLERSW